MGNELAATTVAAAGVRALIRSFEYLYIILEANDSLHCTYLKSEFQFSNSSNKTPKYFADLFRCNTTF